MQSGNSQTDERGGYGAKARDAAARISLERTRIRTRTVKIMDNDDHNDN
jgi:hypothetical protein